MIIATKNFDQYLVKVDGTGRLTLRNRRFLRKFGQIDAAAYSTPVHPYPLKANLPQPSYTPRYSDGGSTYADPLDQTAGVAPAGDVPDVELPVAVPEEPVDVPGDYLPVEVPVDVPVTDSEEHVQVPVADPEEQVRVPNPRGRPPKKRQYFKGTTWQSMRPSEEASQQQQQQQQHQQLLSETPDKQLHLNDGGASRFSTRQRKQRKTYDSASGTYVLPSN